jgi:hypothetical protein
MDLVPPTDKAQRPAVRVDLNPVPLVLAAWSSVLAAHLIATAGGPHWRLLGFQLLVSGCLFVAGSLLAQCSGDRSGHGDGLGASPPERPGSRFRCWALGYGLLAAGLVTALVAGPGVLWVAAPLALSFVAWSANRRSGPASAITYGLVHWFNWLLGMSAGILLLPELLLALPVLLYASAAELTRRAELAPHRMTETTANVDSAEIDKFEALASRWWDPASEFKPCTTSTRCGWVMCKRRTSSPARRCWTSAAAAASCPRPWPAPAHG